MTDGSDTGSIELGALLLFLFVATFLSCLSLYGAIAIRHSLRNVGERQSRAEAFALICSIVSDMQVLVDDSIDYPGNPSVLDLESKYSSNALRITDASSAFHLDFMPDDLLRSASIQAFIYIYGAYERYEEYRAKNGPMTDESQLSAFARPEAIPFCTIHGWINERERPEFACKIVERNFGINDAKNAFPLINNLAMMNINMLDPAALIPLIRAGVWGIKNVNKAETRLLAAVNSGPVGDAEIASALGVSAKSRIFSFLGGKTSFWRVSLKHGDHAIRAIVAGIPEEIEGSRRIREYRLIDWGIRDAP